MTEEARQIAELQQPLRMVTQHTMTEGSHASEDTPGGETLGDRLVEPDEEYLWELESFKVHPFNGTLLIVVWVRGPKL